MLGLCNLCLWKSVWSFYIRSEAASTPGYVLQMPIQNAQLSAENKWEPYYFPNHLQCSLTQVYWQFVFWFCSRLGIFLHFSNSRLFIFLNRWALIKSVCKGMASGFASHSFSILWIPYQSKDETKWTSLTIGLCLSSVDSHLDAGANSPTSHLGSWHLWWQYLQI